MSKKELFLGTVTDAVSDIFYYDRQDDDELTVEDVEQLIESQEISLEQICDTFRSEILKAYPDIQQE